MKRILCLALFSIVFFYYGAGAEMIIQEDEQLNLERCIEISLRQHPHIRASKNSVDVSRSRMEQAKANYFPQIDASASYSRTNPASGNRTALLETNRSYNQYNGSIAIRQNLLDFGKTWTQVNIQRLYTDASIYDLQNVSEQVILNLKKAYYSVLKAKKNRSVAEETIGQFQKHFKQATAFYEVGTKPKFDVIKAEVDLSAAKLNLIRDENTLRIAIVNLNNAMGIPEAPRYDLHDNLFYEKFTISLDDAVDKAYKNRYDLNAFALRRTAAEISIELAKKGHYPFLTGNAAFFLAGERFPLDDGWNAGAAMTFPIFNGFLIKNQVAEAKAELEVIRANEESLRQAIFLEVQESYLNIQEAEERITVAELTVKQAIENFEIATGRYNAGIGNPIEVTDAQVLLSNARAAHIEALYDYKVARATIEKAMGDR